MGSNPILAAIYQGNYRATPVARLARGRQLLPDFYRLCVAAGGGVALVVLKRMHVDARLRGVGQPPAPGSEAPVLASPPSVSVLSTPVDAGAGCRGVHGCSRSRRMTRFG